jgi:hypothetical protein
LAARDADAFVAGTLAEALPALKAQIELALARRRRPSRHVERLRGSNLNASGQGVIIL